MVVSLVAGLSGIGCASRVPFHPISFGMDEQKVHVSLDRSGLEASFLPEQIFVVGARAGDRAGLTPLVDLGRPLKVGDRLVVVHRVVRVRPRGVKALIVAYDVVALAAAVTLTILTYGAGTPLAKEIFIDPFKPIHDGLLEDAAASVSMGIAAAMAGDFDAPRLQGVEPGDVVAFYRTQEDRPILGPATTSELAVIDLWARPWEQAGRLDLILDLLRPIAVLHLEAQTASLLRSVTQQPLRSSQAVISPLVLHIRSNRRSVDGPRRLAVVITARNTLGPELSDLLLAVRPPKGLTVLKEHVRGTGRTELGTDGLLWWRFRRVGLGERLKVRLACEVDLRRLR